MIHSQPAAKHGRDKFFSEYLGGASCRYQASLREQKGMIHKHRRDQQIVAIAAGG